MSLINSVVTMVLTVYSPPLSWFSSFFLRMMYSVKIILVWFPFVFEFLP